MFVSRAVIEEARRRLELVGLVSESDQESSERDNTLEELGLD